MTIVAALVKYNPCSVHARRGMACPFFSSTGSKKCSQRDGSCDTPDYDGWLKDAIEDKIKCFYPRRISLLEIPGAILLLYHCHRRAIIGEAKIVKATSENNVYRYWFEKLLLYPNPVNLKLLRTDSRMAQLARGRWRLAYLAQETVDEIRDLAELEGESRERLKRELELVKQEAEKHSLPALEKRHFFLDTESRRLLDLGMEQEALTRTKDTFLELNKRKAMRGWPSKVVFYASLYLAYRSLSIPKRLNNIAEIGQVNPKKLKSAVKLLMRMLEIRLPYVSPKEWILNLSRKPSITTQTVEMAIDLADDIRTIPAFRSRSPISIAATALYIAVLKTGDHITQRQIAECTGISGVTLRNLAKFWFELQSSQKSKV